MNAADRLSSQDPENLLEKGTNTLDVVIDSGLVGWRGLTRRADALFWDRPIVAYHRVYFSIQRRTLVFHTRNLMYSQAYRC